MINVWADGSITQNVWGKKETKHLPPHAWCGWIAKDESGKEIHSLSLDLGEHPDFSQNTSEYMAVRSALRWLIQNGYANQQINVHTDSQLIVKQLNGAYQAHDLRMRLYRDNVREIAKEFLLVLFIWIPREQNQEADKLSKALQVK